jgi:hypothetical protein
MVYYIYRRDILTNDELIILQVFESGEIMEKKIIRTYNEEMRKKFDPVL